VVGPAVELTVDANWKLIMDGFLETYHLRFLHATTLTRVLHGDQAPFEAFGDHSRHAVPRLSYDPTVHRGPEDYLTNVLIEYTLFPNTNLMWAIDHFEVYRVEPIGGRPDRSRVRLTLLVDPATAGCVERWEKNLEIARRVIVSEDFAAARSIQRALDGGAAPPEFVLGRNEAPLQHYHRRLDAHWS
jgi:phenylpropionate dioxygenase-like ring-hydroxylating dioxygenase large terminal subunit